MRRQPRISLDAFYASVGVMPATQAGVTLFQVAGDGAVLPQAKLTRTRVAGTARRRKRPLMAKCHGSAVDARTSRRQADERLFLAHASFSMYGSDIVQRRLGRHAYSPFNFDFSSFRLT